MILPDFTTDQHRDIMILPDSCLVIRLRPEIIELAPVILFPDMPFIRNIILEIAITVFSGKLVDQLTHHVRILLVITVFIRVIPLVLELQSQIQTFHNLEIRVGEQLQISIPRGLHILGRCFQFIIPHKLQPFRFIYFL